MVVALFINVYDYFVSAKGFLLRSALGKSTVKFNLFAVVFATQSELINTLPHSE